MGDRLKRAARAFAKFVIEPFDFVVAVVLVLAGIAFAVFLALDGATAIEVGLVLLLVAAALFRWMYTSWALDWWRARANDPSE